MALDSKALKEIYSGLAEILSPSRAGAIPHWFFLEGKKWPLLDAAHQLASQKPSSSLRKAIEGMTKIPSASRGDRWLEYEALFYGSQGPRVWLYESYYIDGRVAGPSSFQLKKIYSQAGLEFNGSELSDHATGELSFLAYLLTQEEDSAEPQQIWKSARQLFIQNHVQRWLPDVGRQFIHSAYPAWQAIGHLLIATSKPTEKAHTIPAVGNVPELISASICDLCGFCSQICPTRALSIAEDRSSTSLRLESDLCIHCNKCQDICPQKIIAMVDSRQAASGPLLRTSPRVRCPKCGSPHVSEAELHSVADRIGYKDYLNYCVACRGL